MVVPARQINLVGSASTNSTLTVPMNSESQIDRVPAARTGNIYELNLYFD